MSKPKQTFEEALEALCNQSNDPRWSEIHTIHQREVREAFMRGQVAMRERAALVATDTTPLEQGCLDVPDAIRALPLEGEKP